MMWSFARFEGMAEDGSDIPVAVVVHNVNHPNFEIDIIDMSNHEGPYSLGDGDCIALNRIMVASKPAKKIAPNL